MAKVVLDDVSGGYDLSLINSNFQKIEDELNGKVLYRDNPVGEPNTLETNVDVNSKRLYNLPEPLSNSEAARLEDVQNALAGGAANLISFTPAGTIAADNVQVAIQELDDETQAYKASLLSDTGASLVGFTLGDVNAISRTVEEKLQDFISFEDYCVGDGSDEAIQLQAALTYASANNKAIVDYSGKTYTYGTTLNVGSVQIYGNITLNGTGGAYLNVTGSITEIGYISAAATTGNNQITLSSVSGLAAKDIIILWNSVNSSYSIHRTNYHDGEFVRIEGITGSVVDLQSNLFTSYSGVTTNKVFKISGISVVIDGITLLSDGVFAVRVQYADGAILRPREVRTSGNQAALIINKCYNTKIYGGKYFTPYDGIGGNYGISISNCQYVEVTGVDAYGGRHAVTTGGDSSNGAVPCRFVYIRDSILTNDPVSAVYSADFHGNTLDSFYQNCTIYGRIGLAGERVAAKNCKVYSWPASNTAPLGYHELVGGECLFENCIAIVGLNSTATSIISNLSSALTANISKTYQIVVKNLDATLNGNVTTLINAYENSGQPNAWVLDVFGIRGTISGLTSIISYTKVAPGVDASYIYVTNPRLDTSSYTLVAKSGTTLPNCRFLFPSFIGSNANGSYTKFPDGTMVCTLDFSSASEAISTAFLGGFRTGILTWTYPAVFSDNPRISITPDDATSFSGVISTAAGGTSMTFYLTAVTSQGAAARSARLIAVGRWY